MNKRSHRSIQFPQMTTELPIAVTFPSGGYSSDATSKKSTLFVRGKFSLGQALHRATTYSIVFTFGFLERVVGGRIRKPDAHLALRD